MISQIQKPVVSCNLLGSYTRLDFRPIGEKPVRIITKEDSKIIIVIKTAERNKDGKMEYETMHSIDVQDATPDQVYAAIINAIRGPVSAPAKK